MLKVNYRQFINPWMKRATEDEDDDEYEDEPSGGLNQNGDSIVLLSECFESRAWSPLVSF